MPDLAQSPVEAGVAAMNEDERGDTPVGVQPSAEGKSESPPIVPPEDEAVRVSRRFLGILAAPSSSMASDFSIRVHASGYLVIADEIRRLRESLTDA
jgi:hypothetical protein